jgi:endonuclease-3
MGNRRPAESFATLLAEQSPIHPRHGPMMVVMSDLKLQAAKVVRALRREYPDAQCALRHENPLQLLIATILSAQCTDKQVNLVTPELFAKYPAAQDWAKLPIETLERALQSTGFFRNKAKNIKACCQQLVEKYGGEVPREMELLVELPGVGRKTANVVLGTAYGLPTGVVVDTHVARISRRLGLTKHADPAKIERDLMDGLPRKEWIDFSHRMIHHGRRICKARRPLCEQCSLSNFCPRIGVEESERP